MNKELKKGVMGALQKAFDEMQERPNQFVVAYYKVSDDSLIGYHASTLCQLTQDILDAKRYASEDPYPQLAIISKNLRYTLANDHSEESLFSEIHKSIKEDSFNNMKPEEVYMDAIYLAEDTPKQSFRYTIIGGE